MTSKVLFNIDTKLKAQAQKKARLDGLSFSDILQMSTRAYVEGKLEPRMIQPEPEKFNDKTRKILNRRLNDLDNKKNIVGSFKSAKKMDAYLDSI